MVRRPRVSRRTATVFAYTTLFRSGGRLALHHAETAAWRGEPQGPRVRGLRQPRPDRRGCRRRRHRGPLPWPYRAVPRAAASGGRKRRRPGRHLSGRARRTGRLWRGPGRKGRDRRAEQDGSGGRKDSLQATEKAGEKIGRNRTDRTSLVKGKGGSG